MTPPLPDLLLIGCANSSGIVTEELDFTTDDSITYEAEFPNNMYYDYDDDQAVVSLRFMNLNCEQFEENVEVILHYCEMLESSCVDGHKSIVLNRINFSGTPRAAIFYKDKEYYIYFLEP